MEQMVLLWNRLCGQLASGGVPDGAGVGVAAIATEGIQTRRIVQALLDRDRNTQAWYRNVALGGVANSETREHTWRSLPPGATRTAQSHASTL